MDDGFDVNITARAKPHHLRDCAIALAGVSKLTLKTANSVSPGSDTQLRYLSVSPVSAGKPLTVAYTAKRVITHFMQKKFLLDGGVTDDPDDLMVVVRATQVR